MPTEVERLVARLEVNQRQFERQLNQANRTATRSANRIQRTFEKANARITRGFRATGSSIRGLLAFTGAALGTRQLIRYADAWTQIENQIRSAEQISGRAARTTSALVDIANETRSGLEETAGLYARLLRVSGALVTTEEEVAQITTTVAKAFKAGGAAASEQAAGVLQLSQALGSGFLQGDELRSLRENAPLVAQAIATEFETTIGGLKKLGAEGKLTSDRVFRALINAQDEIQDAFEVTSPTIRDGFTALRNGFIELVAAFSSGSGAADGAAVSLQGLGNLLAESAEDARIFGARLSESFAIIGDAYGAISDAFEQSGVGASIDELGIAFGDVAFFISETLRTVIATAAGVGAAVAQAMLRSVTGVADGATAIVNAGIAAIEGLLNGVVSGFNAVLTGINKVIAAANGLGADIPLLSNQLRVGLERFDSPVGADSRFRNSVTDAFTDAFDQANSDLDEFERGAIGVFDRIKDAGDRAAEEIVFEQSVGTTEDTAPRRTRAAPDSDTESGGGKGKESDISQFREGLDNQQQALRDQIALIGLEARELEFLEAKQGLLNEAKRRGLDLDRRYGTGSETLRQEINRQAETVADLALKYSQAQEQAAFFDTQNRALKDGMVDAIAEGKSLSGVLEDIAKSFAKAAIEGALFNTGGLSLGSGGGLLGGLFGGLIPGFANGTNNAPGGLAIVGERGPELVNLPRGSQVIPNSALGGGIAMVEVDVFVRDDGRLGAIASQAGAQAALPVAVRVVEQNNARVPGLVAESQARA